MTRVALLFDSADAHPNDPRSVRIKYGEVGEISIFRDNNKAIQSGSQQH